MEKYNEEIHKVNSDSKFVEFLTAEEDSAKYVNTVKKLEYNKGIEKGIEKGSLDATENIVRNLKKLNVSIDDIVKATGLSIEEVEKL